MEGDAISAKVTEQFDLQGSKIWVSYGITTTVQPMESEGVVIDETTDEIAETVNEARSRAIFTVMEGVQEMKRDFISRRRQAIQQRKAASYE